MNTKTAALVKEANMRVQFKTRRAGPGGVVSPGQVVNLPDDEAEEAIKSGFAEAAEEVATAEPPENTSRRSRRPRGRRSAKPTEPPAEEPTEPEAASGPEESEPTPEPEDEE